MSSLGHIFTVFAAKVLDFDHTALPEQQFALIQDLLAGRRVRVQGKEAKDLLACLKKKHLVNSITVRNLKSNLVFSSTGNGMQESKFGESIVNFVNKSFAPAGMVTLKTDKEWVMFLPQGDSLYIVKANSSLSTIELRALSREIDKSLKRRHLS